MQRIALGKMRGQRPSCRKTGAKTPESTIRGRSRRRTRYLGTFHLHRAQQNPRSQEFSGDPKRANLFPTCPALSICANSDGKNDNMPPRNPEGTPRPRDDAPRTQARTSEPRHADPQRHPPVKRLDWNKPPSSVPNREKATRGAASKGRAELRRFG